MITITITTKTIISILLIVSVIKNIYNLIKYISSEVGSSYDFVTAIYDIFVLIMIIFYIRIW